jgi:hypothetical protein
MEKNMAKRPSNIYSWSLARVYHHNKRFKKDKKVNMENIMEIIDRSKEWVVQAHIDKVRDKDILDNQVWRLKKYFRIIRENQIKFDMTDNQSHLDYDLLPNKHPFYRKERYARITD